MRLVYLVESPAAIAMFIISRDSRCSADHTNEAFSI